jgi:hypothetical protein
MNPRVERQLRVALHAFPTRWRIERGDELVATARDMLPPEAERVPLAVLVDIVRAGWGERRRRHPPLWRWLHYCLGGKLPARWHTWVSDDLAGRWYWLRAGLRRYASLAGAWWLAFAVMTASSGPSSSGHWSGLIGFAVVIPLSLVMVERMRRQVRKQHGLTATGHPLPPPRIVWVPARTASPPARTAAAAVSVWSGTIAGLMLWRTSMIDDGKVLPMSFVIGAAVTAAVSIGGAILLFRHTRARADIAPHRPPMPRRSAALHIGGTLAVLTGLAGFWWFQLEPGAIFPNGRFIALIAGAASFASSGVALARRPVTLADLVSSREQLRYLSRQGASVAG